MNRKLLCALSLALLGCFGLPAWSQQPPPPGGTQVVPSAPAPLPTSPSTAPTPSAAPLDKSFCLDPEPSGSWGAGAALVFTTTYFQGYSAFTSNGQTTNFVQIMDFSPAAWLGYSFNNGWGLQVSWLDLNGTVNESSIYNGGTFTSGIGHTLFPILGTTVEASQHLGVDEINFEVTHAFKAGDWALVGTAGLRYAAVNEGFSITTTTASETASNTFSGVGPTISLTGQRGIAGTNFAFYGAARGSLLFGTFHDTLAVTGLVTGSNGSVANSDHATPSFISVGELEFGGQWTHDFGQAKGFVQLGLVSQIWLQTDANAGAGLADLALFGGVVRVGFNF